MSHTHGIQDASILQAVLLMLVCCRNIQLFRTYIPPVVKIMMLILSQKQFNFAMFLNFLHDFCCYKD